MPQLEVGGACSPKRLIDRICVARSQVGGVAFQQGGSDVCPCCLEDVWCGGQIVQPDVCSPTERGKHKIAKREADGMSSRLCSFFWPRIQMSLWLHLSATVNGQTVKQQSWNVCCCVFHVQVVCFRGRQGSLAHSTGGFTWSPLVLPAACRTHQSVFFKSLKNLQNS